MKIKKMKAKYTKKQIQESIKHWQKVLESMTALDDPSKYVYLNLDRDFGITSVDALAEQLENDEEGIYDQEDGSWKVYLDMRDCQIPMSDKNSSKRIVVITYSHAGGGVFANALYMPKSGKITGEYLKEMLDKMYAEAGFDSPDTSMINEIADELNRSGRAEDSSGLVYGEDTTFCLYDFANI